MKFTIQKKERRELKIESLENKLTKEVDIVRNEINRMKLKYESNLQLNIQKLALEKQMLEFRNEVLVKKNNYLKKMVIEEFNKNKLLIKKNNNLKKTIKEENNNK